MKLIAIILFMISSLLLSSQKNQKVYLDDDSLCKTGAYQLVFNDEFDDTTLDRNKWYTYYPYGPKGSDQCSFCRTHSTAEQPEGQIYRDKNVRVEKGILYLDIKKENGKWYEFKRAYTSGMIHSKRTFNTFSKYEIRCKIPKGQGFWPAFWAFGWTTEIDVFEFGTHNPYTFLSSVHDWKNDVSVANQWIKTKVDLSKDFHVYAVEYEPNFVHFYLDHKRVATLTKYLELSGDHVLNCHPEPGYYIEQPEFPKPGQPLQVIANVAVGYSDDHGRRLSAFTGAPGPDAMLPNTMEIDYIRVYQREDSEQPVAHQNNIQPSQWSDKPVTLLTNMSTHKGFMYLHAGVSNLLNGIAKDYDEYSGVPSFSVGFGLEKMNAQRGWDVMAEFKVLGAKKNDVGKSTDQRLYYLGVHPNYFFTNNRLKWRAGLYLSYLFSNRHQRNILNTFDVFKKTDIGLSLSPSYLISKTNTKDIYLSTNIYYSLFPIFTEASGNDFSVEKQTRNISFMIGLAIQISKFKLE